MPTPRERHADDLPKDLAQSDLVFGASLPTRPLPPPEDRIELWGRRIGRTLAVIAAVAIVVFVLLPLVSR
jgi:hypothetical protein